MDKERKVFVMENLDLFLLGQSIKKEISNLVFDEKSLQQLIDLEKLKEMNK